MVYERFCSILTNMIGICGFTMSAPTNVGWIGFYRRVTSSWLEGFFHWCSLFSPVGVGTRKGFYEFSFDGLERTAESDL